MMVTKPVPVSAIDLSAEWRASVRLAVAQWLRSARGVVAALEELGALGVAEDERFRRRRAESIDPALQRALRFAVTVVIARGRLNADDYRRLGEPPASARARALVDSASQAFAEIVRLEAEPEPRGLATIDLDVGDY